MTSCTSVITGRPPDDSMVWAQGRVQALVEPLAEQLGIPFIHARSVDGAWGDDVYAEPNLRRVTIGANVLRTASDPELDFAAKHELGHVYFGHPNYPDIPEGPRLRRLRKTPSYLVRLAQARRNELAADAFAIRAGADPAAATALLLRREQARLDRGEPMPSRLYRDHPRAAERGAQMERVWRELQTAAARTALQ